MQTANFDFAKIGLKFLLQEENKVIFRQQSFLLKIKKVACESNLFNIVFV